MAAISRRAGPATSNGRRRFLGTVRLGGKFGRGLFVNLVKEIVEFLFGVQRCVIASLDGVKAFPGGGAKPFELGFVFLLALFQEPETFANDFAGVAEPAGG